MADKFKFKGIEKLQRKPDVEGELGIDLAVGGGITLITLAASENNPRWRAGREDMLNEIGRLNNANAPAAKIRAYLADEYSRRLLIGWYYTDPESNEVMEGGIPDEDGHPIPFTTEAAKQFLIAADDAFEKLENIVYKHQHFRQARAKLAVELVKN